MQGTVPTPLIDLPIAELSPAQLSLFSRKAMHSVALQDFDVAAAVTGLGNKKGQKIIAVDMGGDTLSVQLYKITSEGSLEKQVELEYFIQSSGGKGYLEVLEQAAAYATKHNIPVGVSYAGMIHRSKPQDGPNVKIFREELDQKYNGDFANLFPTLVISANDAVAGLIAGSVEAYKQHASTKDVIYIINGSGLGGAVLQDSKIYTAELGHVPVIKPLNKFDQQNKCGVMGAEYTCLEVVAANKAGIEDQWYKRTNEKLSGREIEGRYKAGDEFACDLYDHSALLAAHAIVGVASVFGIDLPSSATAVVGHGGAFKFPLYGDRIKQIIGAYTNSPPRLLLAKDFSTNSCLEGAALAAISRL